MIDLRSDTVTRPTDAMRAAMANAEVGDDAIDTDPTVERLERYTAEVLGKEDAIYMPSGTMTNQVAIRVLCTPGDEFLCEERSHIFNYQQGGFAQLSGIVARTVRGDNGILRAEQLVDLIRPDSDHMVRTRLLCLENTHNRASGRVQPYDVIRELTIWARDQGLRTHLDGARLFNAVVATGIDAADWAAGFDTVSVCYSKGLGAPVGSALAGAKDVVHQARRHRKLFGGGMRQAGIIAAGALHALENHVERLADDHQNATIFANGVRDAPGMRLVDGAVESNIVIFDVNELGLTAAEFARKARERGTLLSVVGPRAVRAVTHLDVDETAVRQAIEVVQQIAAEVCAAGSSTS